ncbi:MAG: YfhO family protein, partial [Pseudobutyrivibrio sp.]|nr:YfhO family protein [Pseudobutyrivibrio sp.]
LNKNYYYGLAELLGGKYFVTNEYPEIGSPVAVYYSNEIPYYLVETAACPIGFAIDSYISESDLKDIPVEYRAIALLQAAVVDDNIPTDSISGLNRKYVNDISTDYSIEEACYSTIKKSVSNFSKDGHGFTCSSSYIDDTYVYFSVPYDKGWTATIDGVNAEIINSGGMMLLAVPSGSHDIAFSYITPGYNLGMKISLLCWVIFISIYIYKIVTKRKNINS